MMLSLEDNLKSDNAVDFYICILIQLCVCQLKNFKTQQYTSDNLKSFQVLFQNFV